MRQAIEIGDEEWLGDGFRKSEPVSKVTNCSRLCDRLSSKRASKTRYIIVGVNARPGKQSSYTSCSNRDVWTAS